MLKVMISEKHEDKLEVKNCTIHIGCCLDDFIWTVIKAIPNYTDVKLNLNNSSCLLSYKIETISIQMYIEDIDSYSLRDSIEQISRNINWNGTKKEI